MASYLQIENISKSYGPKILFEHIGFNVNEGDKIALIAPNGTGKTSLMRILAGKDKSDSGGRILFLKDIHIAFLEQEYDFDPQLPIFDQIIRHSAEATAEFHGERREEFERKVHEFLSNFRIGDHYRKMGGLSGGEIKRVALSEMLALDAEFLIMDEPTNHLDIEAIEYLEGYLKRSRCTLLMVTHDRYFLDRVCNIVMELDHGAVYTYKGNYQNYLEKRDERITNYNAQTDKVRNLLRRELEWIHATPCARTGKAKYRINAFHELQERSNQVYTTKQISLEGVGSASRLGSKIIDCHHLCYDWMGEPLLKDFSYKFQRCDKIGIVGRNGVGKSTFLDLLTGVIEPSSGVIERGESLKIGYYRQSGMSFEGDQTVLETVNDTRLLGRFLFPHDMLSTKVSRLSGGEKRRLYLLTILMQEPNLLILDEPTNDLDIVTLNILEEYLKEFKGSLLIVSHDRHFLDRVAEHLLVFCGKGVIKDFVGNFSEYRQYVRDYEAKLKQEENARARKNKAEPTRATESRSANPDAPRKLSFKEKRELEQIEARLPELEEEKSTLENKMSSGALSYEELRQASERIEEIIAETDSLETRWLELQV
ncbi:MAG: ABC-F family ATP-binding cassette domain-containing protein [Bacteroidales bacterium]|nr:ABC-F family ATP-binding cassette domain-containing protein [Bacteroidales bacterium]